MRRAMSNAATDLAEALGAKAILAATATGRTASEIARLRPRRPIDRPLAPPAGGAADGARVGRAAALMPSTADVDDLWTRTIETARDSGAVEAGDLVVLIAGTAVNESGSTNVIKVDVA